MRERREREIRRILFDSFAPGSALHASLIAHERGRGYEVTEHRHDFYEMMWVVAGEGVHGVNGATRPLLPRDLVFLRPDDAHYVKFRAGRKLYYINVCINASAWKDFRVAAGIGDALEHGPLTLSLAMGPQAQAASAVFEGVLHLYQGATQPVPRLELCRFLSTVLPHFLPSERAERDDADLAPGAPKWLVDACHRLRSDPDALRMGLPRFVEMAGVSAAHLTRTLKAATGGKTPTVYINELRLARAATLLATSPLNIVDIAGDCGFEQLSYFYRLFGQRFGQSPNTYRLAARRAVGLWSAREGKGTLPATPFGPASSSGIVVVNGLELGGAAHESASSNSRSSRNASAPRVAPPVAAVFAEGGIVPTRSNGNGAGDSRNSSRVGDGIEGVPPPSWRRG